MKPTIGIVGGCGPLATLDIEHKILKATQSLLHPLVDQDYFNLIVFNRTQFHDRNDAITFKQKNLCEEYLDCTNSLISIGADLILIACQTAHVYLPFLQKSIDVPIIDIVQETTIHTSKINPALSKVGLLSTEATQKEKLYQDSLLPFNIDVVTIPAQMQKNLMKAIYIIKTGVTLKDDQNEVLNNHYSSKNNEKYDDLKKHPYRKILLNEYLPNPIIIIKEAINYLAQNGCKHIILGCTELPLILNHINVSDLSVNLIDPNTIVAESTVHFAHKLEKEYSNITDFKIINMEESIKCAESQEL